MAKLKALDLNTIPYKGKENIYTQLIYYNGKKLTPGIKGFVDLVIE